MTVPTPAPDSKKIIVASYPTTMGAKSGLDRLKNAGARLGNVALVQRMADGRVEFTETQDWGLGKSAAVGALAAMLLPGIGLITGALLGGVAAHFIDAGFPDALLKQMGSGIPEGTSLLIALTEEADLLHAERVVLESGGTMIGSGLEADLERAMGKLR
ncbi:MAG: DUF1269 domain-containing protein [Gemmatimonadetes bacterium]|nr:DUF1269 domain-containing protein [Gemmatimonadota bacterium]